MRATTEFANKRKCIALKQATQSMHSNSSDLTTAQQTPKKLKKKIHNQLVLVRRMFPQNCAGICKQPRQRLESKGSWSG